MAKVGVKRLTGVVRLWPRCCGDMTALKESLKVAEDLFLHLSWLSEDSVACSDVKRLRGGVWLLLPLSGRL